MYPEKKSLPSQATLGCARSVVLALRVRAHLEALLAFSGPDALRELYVFAPQRLAQLVLAVEVLFPLFGRQDLAPHFAQVVLASPDPDFDESPLVGVRVLFDHLQQPVLQLLRQVLDVGAAQVQVEGLLRELPLADAALEILADPVQLRFRNHALREICG